MFFHYPRSFFLLFGLAVIIAVYIWSSWQRRRDLHKLAEWRLLKGLIPVEALIRRKKKDLVGLIGLFFIFIAATGPQFGARLKEVKQRGVDVFIALDTSRSMLAEDVPPSRLDRAKRSLSLLISKLEGNRVGIIAFAKFAVIQCPLTVDSDAAKIFLDLLDENAVPEQGTAIGDAIRLGIQSFSKDDKTGRAIVLLTDGEDHRSDPVGAAELAKEKGVVVFTIGIGTSQGEVIKKKDAQGKVIEFLKHDGEMVLSRLDDGLLTKIAQITGGQYYRASSTDKEIDEIAEILNGFDKKEFSSKIYEQYEERYQIFLWIGFLLLLIEFFFSEKPGQINRLREKMSRTSLLILLLFIPSVSQANMRDHILLGNKLLKKQDLKGARGEFESAQIDAPDEAFIPYNIAATYLLEGNFDEAKRYYEQAKSMARTPDLKSKCAYNLGHVYFYQGKKEEAIQSLKECLKLNPKDLDAKYNIEYIRSGKTPKQPPPQQQQQKQDGGSDKNDQKQYQQGQGQSDEQKKQQQKENDAKENAERVLQMIQEQEKDKMKDGHPVQMGKSKKDKKDQDAGEDW